MVRLREIPRTAAFAWSPDATASWIATGTKSGAVDVDFSNETCLELWNLNLDNTQQGQELQPSVTLPTETGFHDLAWTPPQDGYKRGIIAGAFDDGTLGLWDADKTLTSSERASIFSNKIHSGAIKALQFNPKIQNFLATGGARGELYISDLNHLNAPIRLGSTAARADDIDCLDWNKKVSNILVTGSSGGFVTVWDMKTRKESLTLNNYQRKPASAIAWDPEKPTRLITAVPLEQEPVILVWDLRNSNAPEKVLRGHDSGVLSLSWCPQDNDLLLSCGKDNRTILWNPQTGQPYGDYPVVTNWTFQTRWNPHNPNMFATASFDGKLQIQTLQNTNPSFTQTDQNQAADGEDFFSKAQIQPQSSSFSMPKAPKWLERPVSVSFGFGGRIISVRQSEPGKSRASKVSISKFEVDSSVGTATETFEKAIHSGDLTSLCEQRIASAKTDEEKADWKVIETLVSKNPRAELVKYLGFEDPIEDAANGVEQLDLGNDKSEEKPSVNGGSKAHKRFQSIFASSADGDFLSELAATKGTKTNNPFQIYTGSESEADRKITRALILGQFEKALDICLLEDRMSDAFMIAICGGESCIKKAQEVYFAKQSDGPNYLRLLASIVGKNLWDTVHNADLTNWKEVMATLCTFADEQEFPDLCEALGDRIEEQTVESSSVARQDASFCFLAGSKLEKVVAIWIDELKEHEEAGATEADASSAFSLHAHGLQDFIEKVTIFRKVVNFQDGEISKSGEWKLENLYSKYLEYADIVAGSGQLDVAQRYLDLLPTTYPGADIARSRIQQARKKSAAPAAVAQATPITSRNKPLPGMSTYQPPTASFTPPTPQAPTYGGNPTQPANPYAPPTSTSAPVNPYAPAGSYQPPQQMRMTPGPPPPFGMPQANTIQPPPRFNQSPAIPPPSQDKNTTNWNDIPEGFVKPPTSRRGTPGIPPQSVQNPYSQIPQAQQPSPPTAPPFGSRQKASPVPPPPKGSAPPPRVTSPLAGGLSHAPFERPGSSASNAYAPPAITSPPPLGQNVMSPPIARGPSPYNAPPPSQAPMAPNRYAPAPGTQTSTAPPSRPSIAPPPQAPSFQVPSQPANPYAPSQLPQQARSTSYGAPQSVTAPPLPTPAQQFTSGPPPSSGPPQHASSRPDTAGSDKRSTTLPARKHAKGDRTHIPPSAQPIYQILSSEMSRVKARAPASFKAQVIDTEKRLDILFDHLNNEDLLKSDTVAQIADLANALQARDFQRASEIQMDVHTNKVEECGNWMVGVKRLVGMCKATP